MGRAVHPITQVTSYSFVYIVFAVALLHTPLVFHSS